MRYVFILLLWLMATGQTLAQSGTGKTTGTIRSAQGDPLPGICVRFEGTLFGIPTNGAGDLPFPTFRSVPNPYHQWIRLCSQ
jgi:hypothetical protein